ncbi:MAG: hypothetical protein K6A65_04360 [Succinivibrionaceae bacterium]|nr:hypothetical protein [Succinivibrionaceae bacterium]
MTDQIRNTLANLSSAEVRNFDFSGKEGVLTQKQLQGLLSAKGEISIDEGGNFIAINAPEKRDGAITRFFKGLFSADYRAEQHKLNVMEALQRNPTFQELLKEGYKACAISKLALTKEATLNEKSLCGSEIDRLAKAQGNKLTLEDMRQYNRTLNSISNAIGSVSGIAFAAQGIETGINCGGGEFTVASFCQHFGPGGKGLDLHEIGNSILLKAISTPGAFLGLTQGLGMEATSMVKADHLRHLLAQPSLSDAHKDIMRRDMEALLGAFNKRISEFAQRTLEAGFSPESIAARIGSTLQRLKDGEMDGREFGAIFKAGGPLHPANTDGLQRAAGEPSGIREDLRESLGQLKEAFPGMGKERLAKIIGYTDNQPKAVARYIQVVSDETLRNDFKNCLDQLRKAVDTGNRRQLLGVGRQLYHSVMVRIGDHIGQPGNRALAPYRDKIMDCVKDLMHDYTLSMPREEFKALDFKALAQAENALIEYSDGLSSTSSLSTKDLLDRMEELGTKDPHDPRLTEEYKRSNVESTQYHTALSLSFVLGAMDETTRAMAGISNIVESDDELVQAQYTDTFEEMDSAERTRELGSDQAVPDF